MRTSKTNVIVELVGRWPWAGKLIAALDQTIKSGTVLKVVGLTLLRVLAAVVSLLSVTAIIRFLPPGEAGRLFVFIASSQFIAGAALGPLLILALQHGAIHRENDDFDAMGSLVVFGAVVIIGTVIAVWPLHFLVALAVSEDIGSALILATVVGLSGLLFFLIGLARANGSVILAFVPDNILRPVGIALVAATIGFAGVATFHNFTVGYLLVLLSVVIFAMPMVPWCQINFSAGPINAYWLYIKAYGPLVVFGLVSTALCTFDILLVARVDDLEAVSAYRVAAQYAQLLGTGVMFADFVYAPQIAVAHQRGDRTEVQRLAKATAHISLAFWFAGALPLIAGPNLFRYVFGPSGYEAWLLALVLSIGRLVNAWFGSVTLVSNLTGHTSHVVAVEFIGILIMISIGLLVGERSGALGIGMAAATAHVAWVLGIAFILRRKLDLKLGPGWSLSRA